MTQVPNDVENRPLERGRIKVMVGPVGLEPTTKGFTSAPPFPAGVDYLFTPRSIDDRWVRDALACH